MSIISQEKAGQYKSNAREIARMIGVKPKDDLYAVLILRIEHIQRHAFHDGAIKGVDMMSKTAVKRMKKYGNLS